MAIYLLIGVLFGVGGVIKDKPPVTTSILFILACSMFWPAVLSYSLVSIEAATERKP